MQLTKHHYGENVRLLESSFLSTLLAELCSPETFQPRINELVTFLYSDLIRTVLENEFPRRTVRTPTRMTEKHKKIQLEAEILDRKQRAVTINLARAGTLPSHICYSFLNHVLDPKLVRQDHVFAARVTNASHQVKGTQLGDSKIGGDIEKAVVIFPDPMGATGGTIVSALDYYKKQVKGRAAKFIAVHLIVTPEYLKRVTTQHKDLIIYAVRVDRGLSNPAVLKTEPGLKWDQERGLDDTQYIVPGGGGFGEILNNSFV
jgi:uracil phosphoribosyltransferase